MEAGFHPLMMIDSRMGAASKANDEDFVGKHCRSWKAQETENQGIGFLSAGTVALRYNSKLQWTFEDTAKPVAMSRHSC